MNFNIYFVVAVVHLVAILGGDSYNWLVTSTKPLLLPALMLPFYFSSTAFAGTIRNLVIAALLFSWMGDVVLLFQDRNAIYFLVGLISFLLAHICYIIAFTKGLSTGRKSLLSNKAWLVLIFLAYGIGFFYFIRNGLGEMMIPVIVYECIILLMGITALNRFERVDEKSFQQVFGGALLFMASDSLLAVNKFYAPFLMASFLIMLTYILAQYFIVSGMLQYFFPVNRSEYK